jgi:hypothetical protein
MPSSPSSPLLGDSNAEHERTQPEDENEAGEFTPLLSHDSDAPRYDGEGQTIPSPAAATLRSLRDGQGTKPSSKKRAWPTIIAISTLATTILVIMAGAFFAPAVIEEYAKQSLVIEPTNLSIDSFTSTGVMARIQANFKLDASRVENEAVRNLGRAGTWIARKIESKESKVEVYLPEYGNLLIGTATVPGIVVDIRNGQITRVDFLAELVAGDLVGVRRVANDWLEGRLGELRVQGKTDVALKSGIFPLGTQSISESLVFEGQSLYQTFAKLYFGEKSLG